jgi:hypothetical protein
MPAMKWDIGLRWLSHFRSSALFIAAACTLTATFVSIYAVDLPNRRVVGGADAAIALSLLFGAMAALVLGRKSSRRSRTFNAVALTIVGLTAAMLTALWAIQLSPPTARVQATVDCRISMREPREKARRISDCTCRSPATGSLPEVTASDCRPAKSRRVHGRR